MNLLFEGRTTEASQNLRRRPERKFDSLTGQNWAGRSRHLMATKRQKWLILGMALLPLLLILAGIWVRSRRSSIEHFDLLYLETARSWAEKTYLPLTSREEMLGLLSRIPVEGGQLLTEPQRESLRHRLLDWFEAYSAGRQESFLAFRLPAGVPWRWKEGGWGRWNEGVLEAMSNYFVHGMVFSSQEQEDRWMRRYGHPDNITNFAMLRGLTEDWSTQQRAEVRAAWIARFGDGSASRRAYRPSDPFEQWLTIAREFGCDTWYRSNWTGVCLDEMVIRATAHEGVPPPLEAMRVGSGMEGKGYAAPAPFPNLGYGKEHRKSFIEWQFGYEDLLAEQGRILVADVFAIFRRAPPQFPQPMLLRLTRVEAYQQWVPTEMINAHGMKAGCHVIFF